MLSFSNEELARCPGLKAGEEIECPWCTRKHTVKDSEPPGILTYYCGEKLYVAGIDGKNVILVFRDRNKTP